MGLPLRLLVTIVAGIAVFSALSAADLIPKKIDVAQLSTAEIEDQLQVWG